jgi:hypothetical protein
MTANDSDSAVGQATVSAYARRDDHLGRRAKRLGQLGDPRRDRELARRYGLTLPEFQALRVRGACDICKRSDRRLCIDHCHETNRVRGLICEQCNFGLGLLDDDVGRLEKAEAYLRAPPGVPAPNGTDAEP